jgi:hypothetical protein
MPAPIDRDHGSIIKGRHLPLRLDAAGGKLQHQDGSGTLDSIPTHGVAIGEVNFISDEISQGIDDGDTAVNLQTLQHVRMVPQNRRRTGIH